MFVGQMFFEGPDGSGWSEVYYSDDTDYVTALSDLSNLATDRRGFLPASCDLVYLRISDPDVRGDALVAGGRSAGLYTAGVSCEETSVAVLVRWENPNFFHSNHYLRGVPHDCVGDAAFVPTSTYTTAFNAYVTALKAGWMFARKNQTPPPKFALTPIVTASITRLVTRRAGRPFGLQRGRRLIV